MQIPDLLVVQLLKKTGVLSDDKFEWLKTELKKQKRPVQHLVIAQGLASEEELAMLYAQDLGISYKELEPSKVSPDHLRLIPETSARRLHAIVFDVVDNRPQVATTDPANPTTISFLHKLLGDDVDLFLTNPDPLIEALELYHRLPPETPLATVNDDERPEDHENAIGKTLDTLLQRAVRLGASDIHLEPQRHAASTRFRIDGRLQNGPKLPQSAMALLTSHIKNVAGLIQGTLQTPQTGSFETNIDKVKLTVSISTLPIIDGEKVTLHLETPDAETPSLETLGMWGKALMSTQRAMTRQTGLVLVAGPLNNGRAPLLYSLLQAQARPDSSISTIQERITYRLHGATQTQVRSDAGLTYSRSLQALLGQDPDVILVDNLPDSKSVQLAIQGALDGKLVLAGMSLNNPIQVLSRLLTAQIEPFLFAQAIQLVIGQRSVPRLCNHCCISYKPDKALRQQLDDSYLLSIPANVQDVHQLEQSAQAAGLGTESLASTNNHVTQLWHANKEGCKECQSGYKGSINLLEVISPSDKLRSLIAEKSDLKQLTTQARRDGGISWQLDGLIKALRGLVDIEDVLRV